MNVKSTVSQYGVVAVVIHWLSALLILVLMGSGFWASSLDSLLNKSAVLPLHLVTGLCILLLTLGRISWRLWADNKPEPLAMPLWQARISR